jgi:hypothetical protein
MPKKQAVEGWKMPEGVSKFMGLYRRTFKVAQKLHQGLTEKMAEATVLRNALQGTESQMQQMLMQAPPMELRELSGQED